MKKKRMRGTVLSPRVLPLTSFVSFLFCASGCACPSSLLSQPPFSLSFPFSPLPQSGSIPSSPFLFYVKAPSSQTPSSSAPVPQEATGRRPLPLPSSITDGSFGGSSFFDALFFVSSSSSLLPPAGHPPHLRFLHPHALPRLPASPSLTYPSSLLTEQ